MNGEEAYFGTKSEFAGALGASYKFRGSFFGSARYMYGFTDGFNDDFDKEYEENINNTGFQLGVGFLF